MVPVPLTWDGKRFTPLPQFQRICDRQFVVGICYPMVVEEKRSSASHRHYFAAVHDAWMNLPDAEAARFPSDEHLRHWALIETGYCNEKTYVCDTQTDARKLALVARQLDTFAVIKLSKNVVKIYTARSQSIHAMNAEEFKNSKNKVLDLLSGLIGITRGTLNKEAGTAA
jgi:hypothetical protein